MTRLSENFLRKDSPTADNPAVICGSRTFSYAQFFTAVSGAACHLRDSGIQEHDRVGILNHNNVDYLIALFALWRIGAVACLFSPRLPDHALKEQLKSIHCRRFLTSTDLDPISEALQDHKTDDEQEFNVPFDREATIMFTSGSSSMPKAVLHTFGNHYYSARGSNEHLPIIPGDQWLLSLPLYHVGGLGIIFRAFQGGGSVVIPGPDKPIDQMLKSHKITHLSLVPTQFTRLLRDADCHNALKNLKVILLGGSAIPDSLISDAIKLSLPVYTTYGSTEMASQVATSGRLSEDNPISAGKVLNYRRLMISEEGKILVKGETLFKGYIEKEGMVLPFNENGYFVTGDLGEFSDDGRLIVNGRKDNMFFSGGENIQPEEIERYLCRVKSIERAIVVPVAHQEYGFRPVAFIKASAPMTRKGILNILENDLPKFKIPEEFYLWPENEETDDLKASRRYFTHRIAQHPSSFTSIK